jgi:hypothetical protein
MGMETCGEASIAVLFFDDTRVVDDVLSPGPGSAGKGWHRIQLERFAVHEVAAGRVRGVKWGGQDPALPAKLN